MKTTIILPALLAIAALMGFTKKADLKPKEIERKITVASFNHLTVDGSFTLTLVENDEPAVYLKGTPGFVGSFKFRHKNNSLVVSSSTTNRRDLNQVIIHVKNLKTLIIQQDAVVDAMAISALEDLEVMLNAECLLKVNKSVFKKIKTSDDLYLQMHDLIIDQEDK